MMIEFYQSLNLRRMRRDWYWRARHANGQIMANGAGDGYRRLIDCEQAVRTLGEQFNEATWHYPDDFKLSAERARRTVKSK